MPHGEPVDKSLQETWNRKTGYPQVLDEPIVGGRVGGGEGSVQAEGAGLWTHALTRVHRWTIWGFTGKPNWSIQTKKSRVWYALQAFHPRGTLWGRPWDVRLFITVTQQVFHGHAHKRLVSVQSPCRATCHTKGTKASMLRSSARLSWAAFIKKQFKPSGKNGGRPWPSGCTLMGSPWLSPHD